MTRTTPFRLTALIAACLLSLSSAGQAVAHALVHAHTATEHGASVAALQFAVPTVEDGEHGHGHGHGTIDVATTLRDPLRIAAALAAMPPVLALTGERISAAPSRFVDPTRLPRPGPGLGPPGGPRAPPTC